MSSLPRFTDSQVRFAPLSRSFPSSSPIAEASIARDIEEESDEEEAIDGEEDVETSSPGIAMPGAGQHSTYSFAGTYRRPSFATAGARGTILPPFINYERTKLSSKEREAALAEERSLLRDNNIIPPKHPQDAIERRKSSQFLRIPGGDGRISIDEEAAAEDVAHPSGASENTPLLGDPSKPYGGHDNAKIDAEWDEAVRAGMISTTWQRETKVIATYSAPMIVTFLLQYSLTLTSVFTVGRISSAALGAVSLASMSANIFGYSIYQGLTTSLDTLCAQAYGSGHRKLVGLQFQRMVFFLWVLTIPIGILWLLSGKLMKYVVPDEEVAELASIYLRTVLIGAPGYALFEAAKRYVQAQGLFSAALYVLMFVAPVNAFLSWFFVWHLEMGFIGAPLAVAISDHLLWIGLFIYVYFVDGRQCWNGFTKRAFQNWGPMIKLAIPGLIMVEAEVLAFEVLTFAAARFGVTALAAQSVLATVSSVTFQLPFPLSIATSTRIANLIGATLADAAKVSAKVGLCCAFVVGTLNVVLLSTLKGYIPRLFTDDEEVIEIVASILPLCAAFQLFDALAANCNGILRGLGRQEIGGYVQVFCYYAIAMPISFGTAFGLNWGLWGLWTGVALALGLVAGIEAFFIFRTDWERSVEDAKQRNEIA